MVFCWELAEEKTVTLNVDNMTCASCSAVVKRARDRVAGVKEAEVSLESGTAVVTFDDEKTDITALTAATTNAGFPSRLASEEFRGE